MGLSPIHKRSAFLVAGVFYVCFFLFSHTANAQIQPGDSIKSDTVPAATQGIKGKGGFGNDTIINNVKPSETVGEEKKDKDKEEIKEKEKEKKEEKDTLRPHNPKLAMGMSAVLPGLGQIYNKKYWKLPIVYVGLGVCTYFIWTETSQFSKYKETYKLRLGIDSLATDWFPNETDNTVKEMKEYHHRNLEISYIAAGAIYLLNIVDAAVDAHLYDFNVTDDLSMRIEPTMISYQSMAGRSRTTGVSLTLKF